MNPLAHTPRCEKYNNEQPEEPFTCICMLHEDDCDLRKHDKIFTCTCKPTHKYHKDCTAHNPRKQQSRQDQCYCKSLFQDDKWKVHRKFAVAYGTSQSASIMHALCDLREELDEIRRHF